MKIWNFLIKYDRVLVILLTIVFCVFVLLTALALSLREQAQILGLLFEKGQVGSRNHRLFSLPNGRFLLASEEDGNPVFAEMDPSGQVQNTFLHPIQPPPDLDISYPVFRRGDLLFATTLSRDPESGDFSCSLMVTGLADLPIDWSGTVSEWRFLSDTMDVHMPVSLTADSEGIFYAVNQKDGKLVCFMSDGLIEGELVFPLAEFALDDCWFERVVSVPGGGVYLYGKNKELEDTVWWMDPQEKEGFPEETLEPVASGESVGFPVDFGEDGLALCDDGKLYRVGAGHTFTELGIPFEVSVSGVSQPDASTLLVKSPDNQILEYDWQDLSQAPKVVFDGKDAEIVSFASNEQDTMILLSYPDLGYSRVLLSQANIPEPEEPSSSSGGSQSEESVPQESSGGSLPSQILSDPAEESSGTIPSDPVEESSAVSSGGDGSEPDEPNSQPSSAVLETPSEIISDTFEVTEQGYMVIPPGTTVAQLKSTVQSGGGRLEVRRVNGGVYSSGKLGTGMELTLYNAKGEAVDTVTIMVPGDLNGSATVNTRDEAELFGYLLGDQKLDGVYWHSADYNQDGVVDLMDLLLLKRKAG